MDDLKIVIRQSKKYNLLKKDEETLNFLSRILLSSLLEDDQLAELIQKWSSQHAYTPKSITILAVLVGKKRHMIVLVDCESVSNQDCHSENISWNLPMYN